MRKRRKICNESQKPNRPRIHNRLPSKNRAIFIVNHLKMIRSRLLHQQCLDGLQQMSVRATRKKRHLKYYKKDWGWLKRLINLLTNIALQSLAVKRERSKRALSLPRNLQFRRQISWIRLGWLRMTPFRPRVTSREEEWTTPIQRPSTLVLTPWLSLLSTTRLSSRLRGHKDALVPIWTLQWCKVKSEISLQIQTILPPGLVTFLPLKSLHRKSRDRTAKLGKLAVRWWTRRTVPSILALMNSSRSPRLKQLILVHALKPWSLQRKESNLGFCLLCKD